MAQYFLLPPLTFGLVGFNPGDQLAKKTRQSPWGTQRPYLQVPLGAHASAAHPQAAPPHTEVWTQVMRLGT